MLRTLCRRANTPVLCLSSVPSKDALPEVVFNVAMPNLRVRVYVLLHKILILAKQFVAESNEHNNTYGSASGAHFAFGILLSTPAQTNMDDMHDSSCHLHTCPPPLGPAASTLEPPHGARCFTDIGRGRTTRHWRAYHLHHSVRAMEGDVGVGVRAIWLPPNRTMVGCTNQHQIPSACHKAVTSAVVC